MLRKVLAIVAAVAATAGLSVSLAGVSNAAAPVMVYPGQVITPTTQYPGGCTLAAVGHDKFGNLIGLTAGHCSDGVEGFTTGGPVYANENEGAGVLGTFTYSSQRPDVAVIRFDPSKVVESPTNPHNGYTVNHIGVVQWRQVACKDGMTTGITCGLPTDNFGGGIIHTTVWSQPGDSGGPLTQGTGLIGINRSIEWWPFPFTFTDIYTALGAINAAGGPGAGFVPAS